MGNLMTSIYTGVSGVITNQTSINVVSHNLANINTEDYVRQQVVGQDTYYDTLGSNSVSTLQVGYGASIDTIRQVRSVFLDKAYRTESGREEFYNAQSEATDEVEELFGEISGEAFSDTISDFWTAIQELAKEPDSIVKRSALISRATTLIERATSISDALEQYQQNLNTKIQDQVTRVNEIGNEINDLNDQIVKYEATGQNANDLRDTRNSLLDELSGIVKTSYSEDSTGRVTVSIEGRQFVTDSNVLELSVLANDDAQQLVQVVWDDGKNTPLYDLTNECSSVNDSNIGGLKGLLLARGSDGANYTSIPVREDYSSDADYNAAVEEYNEQIEPSIIASTQAQFDQLIHGIVTAVNDVLCPNASVSDYMSGLGITTLSGSSVTLTDDGTSTVLDLSNCDILLWDEANAPVGMDADSTPREELFEREYTERYREAELSYTDENGDAQTKTVYIYNEEDDSDIYSQYTLGQIQINNELQQEVSKLPLSGTSEQGLAGAYDIDVCSDLTDIFDNKFASLSPNEITTYNFSDYYTALTGSIATKGDTFQTLADSQAEMVDSLDNQRQEIMGVSSEEELTNMIKYQWAYNASSKYMNVINDLLDTVINNMG